MKINIIKLLVEVLLAIGRHLLTGVGGFAAVSGAEAEDPRMLTAGVAATLLGLGWSFKRKYDRAKQ